MADGKFVNALGKVAYYLSLPAANDGIVVVLLQAVEADDTLNNYSDLATLIAAAGNTEATFTNYVRKAAVITLTPDDTANDVKATFADLVYAAAGGATNNTNAKLLVCYDPDTTTGTDADIIPLTFHDAVFTTDGTDQTITCPAGGFWTAS